MAHFSFVLCRLRNSIPTKIHQKIIGKNIKRWFKKLDTILDVFSMKRIFLLNRIFFSFRFNSFSHQFTIINKIHSLQDKFNLILLLSTYLLSFLM